MKIKSHLIVFFIIIITFFGCNTQKENTHFDYGRIENNTYTNSYFGFQLQLPEGWVIQSKEDKDKMMEAGKKLIVGDNKNLKAIIDASEVNSANLLTVFKYKIGSVEGYNPGYTIIAENLKNASYIKSGKDYLTQARKLLLQSQLKYDTVSDNFIKEKINGKEFYRMDCSITITDYPIKQSYYSTIENGFSLVITISYVTAAQEKEVKGIINTMKFKR
ncbi:hypothetical protein ACG2LH_15545 [Zhouia sp. PK063]|uniref:hypothetical protein n=1 Tax=Zhouia sp. PK063 TaxID=3373602 RepID=UPI0037B8C3FE